MAGSGQLICGWEWGTQLDARQLVSLTGNAPAVTGSGVTVETSLQRTGTGCLKVVTTSGAASYWYLGTNVSAYNRVYVKITTLPGTARMLLGATGANIANLLLNTDGTLSYRVNTTVQGTSTIALTDTTKWYRVEWRITGVSNVILRIDGMDQVTATGGTSMPGNFGANDTVAATYTAYFDDYGGDLSAYPGEGRVALLLPVSDNSIGSWTAGAGGTSNLFEAVNNTPPAGLASASETDTSNIESAANSATDDCDFNMQSYSAAGIPPGSSVLYVYPVVRHGEDIATNTKSGAMRIVSNPTDSGETTFTYGNDGGAHAGEVGVWYTNGRYGLPTGGSSVVLGTQPVMRVGKRTATTRVVCVDAMGLYVEYVDGNVAPAYHVLNSMPLLRYTR